jgi:aspartate/methionine/tyrosine aminotransferase
VATKSGKQKNSKSNAQRMASMKSECAPRDVYQHPQGTFFCFPNIIAPGISSTNHHNWMLDEAGVALIPGSGFGARGEGTLRLAYANSIENILQA